MTTSDDPHETRPQPTLEPAPLGPAPAARPRPAAVVVDDLHKAFKLPHERISTLKQRVIRPRRQTHEVLRALNGVSFDVREGEFFGIVGRNGSGKSTLLKCMSGIYAPDRGSVTARGRVATFIELGVGFNAELSARDNVSMNGILMGLRPDVIRDKFAEIIAFAELEEFVDMKLKNYSSGMQVRLAFSVAIHVEADILLIDEVLAVGDAAFQRKCFDTFERLRFEGRTVILVTHDMGAVERFCNRALMLEHGEIVSHGEPHMVARDYTEINFDHSAAVGDQQRSRWGDGAAEVLDCWFETADGDRTEMLRQNETAIFKSHVRFKRAMSAPIFGIEVWNEVHQRAFVTNTLWDDLPTRDYAPDDEAIYELRFENHLEDGRYHVSSAVAYKDALKIADWREHMISMTVVGRRKTGGQASFPRRSVVTASARTEPIGAPRTAGAARRSDDADG